MMSIHDETDFFVLIACLFGILGAYYLVISTIKTGKEEIVGLATTFVGDNPIILSALSEQKANSTVGFGLTSLSGLMWFTSAIVSTPLQINPSTFGILIALTIIIIGAAEAVIRFFAKKLQDDVTLISFAYHIEGHLKSDTQKDLQCFNQDAKRIGLSHLLDRTKSFYQNIQQLLLLSGKKEILELFESKYKQ